jgi:hypothetical protein
MVGTRLVASVRPRTCRHDDLHPVVAGLEGEIEWTWSCQRREVTRHIPDPIGASAMAPQTPLLRPDRYFGERDLHPGRVLLAVVIVLFAALGLVYGVGYLMKTNVDGTVLVDNPDRPPEAFCTGDTDPPGFDDDACSEPEQVERNVDVIIDRAIGEIAGSLIVGLALLVAGFTLVVHVGSWLAGGTNGLGASFAVTVWGMTPIVVVAPATFVVLSLTLEPVTVEAAGDPASAFAELETQVRSLGWLETASTVLSAGWSAVIWRFGLEHRRGLTGSAATAVAVVTALLLVAGGAL